MSKLNRQPIKRAGVQRKGLPEIDTSRFERSLEPSELERFLENRPACVKLLDRLIIELQLSGQIEHLKIHVPNSRAELYRRPEDPWPSKRLCLAIYRDKYMCERLLRHELGHEADRWNPEMLYDPAIEERWKGQWATEGAFGVAANISLDSRLGDGGLGKERRLDEFHKCVGQEHDALFEEAWTNPPRTWPDIEELAKRLLPLLHGGVRCPRTSGDRRRP